jgi:hypothetical protein
MYVWFAFVVVAAMLLIGVYALVRLRRHETDAVTDEAP